MMSSDESDGELDYSNVDDHYEMLVHAGPSSAPYDELSMEDRVTSLLASLRLDRRRGRSCEADEETMRRVHSDILELAALVADTSKRRLMRKVARITNSLREQTMYLNRLLTGGHESGAVSSTYFSQLNECLMWIVRATVTDTPVAEEYRKMAIFLGVIEALAEFLVLEVRVFHIRGNRDEHRSLRKLVANALTNLTYKQPRSKHVLCVYPDFVAAVIAIIDKARNLAQVYAGLLRNLSWMADAEMSAALAPTVKPIAAAAVAAHSVGDRDCLRSCLSALWNVASHSSDNKRVICEQPGCLEMLMNTLTPDASATDLVEPASGILKYVTQYLTNTSTHVPLRARMASQLMLLLGSASFTVVTNALSALGSLIAKDPHLQHQLRMNAAASSQLNALRDSARDDVRAAVKVILNHTNQPQHSMYGEMSLSMNAADSSSLRFGSLRQSQGMRASPCFAAPPMASASMYQQSPAMRASTLPRQQASAVNSNCGFARRAEMRPAPQRPAPPTNGFAPPPSQRVPVAAPLPAAAQAADEPSKLLTASEALRLGLQTCGSESSMKATRCTSVQSLYDEQNQSSSVGWNSVLDMSENSGRLSPVTPSELPDSPTHYSRLQSTIDAAVVPTSVAPTNAQLTIRCHEGSNSGGSHDTTRMTTSDTDTANVDDFVTPKFAPPPFASKTPTQSNTRQLEFESDYEAFVMNKERVDLLQRSIASAMPTTSCNPTDDLSNDVNEDLLSRMIESALPVSRNNTLGPGASASLAAEVPSTSYANDDLLSRAIESAMPRSPATMPKNTRGEQRNMPMVTDAARPSSCDGYRNDERDERTTNLVKQQSTESTSSFDAADFAQLDYIDTSLPLDCSDNEDDNVLVDCSALTAPTNSQQPFFASPQQRSRLPTPRGKTQVKSSAVVPPYNYQAPKESEKTNSSEIGKVQVNAKQMLITTM